MDKLAIAEKCSVRIIFCQLETFVDFCLLKMIARLNFFSRNKYWLISRKWVKVFNFYEEIEQNLILYILVNQTKFIPFTKSIYVF